MTPSALHILIASMVDEHDVNVISYKDEPHFLVHQIAAACGSKDPGQIVKLVRGDDEYLDEKHIVTFTGDDLAWLKAHSTTGNGDTHRGIGERINSITAFTLAGLSLFLTKSHLPKGREVRAWLANQVMPAILKTGSYGQPQIEGPAPEPKPADALPGFREARLTLAEMRRNKVATSTIHRVAEQLYSRLGISLTIEAAPTPPAPVASPQLALPLTATTPTPEPTTPKSEPTPKPKRKSGRKSPPPARRLPLSDGDWPRLVRAWLAKYSPGPPKEPWLETVIVSASDLYALGIIEIKEGPIDGRVSRLGKALYERVDTVIDGYKIVHRNSTIRGYSLQKV